MAAFDHTYCLDASQRRLGSFKWLEATTWVGDPLVLARRRTTELLCAHSAILIWRKTVHWTLFLVRLHSSDNRFVQSH